MRNIVLIVVIVLFSQPLTAQYGCDYFSPDPVLNDCSISFDTIRNILTKAFDILDDREISIADRIDLSKEHAHKGLALGYRAIRKGVCRDYAHIIGCMLIFNEMLGKHEEAKMLAIKRLDKVYPGWKKYNQNVCIELEFLRDLLPYTYIRSPNAFYDPIIEYGERPFVCALSYVDRFVEAKQLFHHLGNIYCYRYFQSSPIYLNYNAKKDFQELYDLLIECWIEYIPADQLLRKYEEAEIKQWQPDYYKGDKTRHYLMVDNFVFLFMPPLENMPKDTLAKDYINYSDPESVKYSSLFYSRLKWYAKNRK